MALAATTRTAAAPPPAPSSADAHGIARVAVSRDHHSVVAIRNDGSRFTVFHDRDRVMSVESTSPSRKWATVIYHRASEGTGSNAGSIAERSCLVSIEHRRAIDPETLGFGPMERFDSFAVQNGNEVVIVTRFSGAAEESIPLSTIEATLNRSGGEPPSRR